MSETPTTSRLFLQQAINFHPLVLPLETQVAQAVTAMAECHATCVLVADQGQIKGIFTGRNVVEAIATGLNPKALAILDWMTQPVVMLAESEAQNLFHILQVFQQHHIGHLPILNDSQQILGLITQDSLLQVLNQADMEHLPILQAASSDAEALQQATAALQQEIEHCSLLERSLAESEARYQAIVEHQPDLVCRFLPDGTLTFVNEAYCRYFGQSAETLIGQHWTALIALESWLRLAEQVTHLTSETPHGMVESVIRTAAGELRWQQWRNQGIFNTYGELSEIQAVGQDVSDRKKTEHDLQTSEEQFRLVFDLAPIGMAISQQDGTLVRVNEAFCSTIGYTAEEVIQLSCNALIHPDDREERNFLNQKLWQGELSSFEHERRYIAKSGTIVYVLLKKTVITHTAQGQPLYALSQIVDITARKQAEEAIRQQVKREQLLRSIFQNVRRSLKLQEILCAAVSETRQFLQTDRTVIWQILANRQAIVAAEAIAEDHLSILSMKLPSACIKQRLQFFQQGNIQIITDAQQIAPSFVPEPLRPYVRASLTVPIVLEQKLWGLLTVHQCNEPRQWQATEIDLLYQITNQLNIAIRQSALYQQVQHLNSSLERQVKARTAQLQLAYNFEATLKRITDRVRDSLDEHQILQAAVEELAIAIGARGCNAALYDLAEGTSTIRYEYTTSVSPSQGRTAKIDAFPEIYNQLLQGQSFQFCSLIPNPVRGKTALLTTPIVDDQQVVGDLWLINHSYYGFKEEDIRLVQQVANQCAIAIRQARLYQAAQTQVQELERLNHLKDDFLSTVSHELRTPMTNIKMAIQMLEVAAHQQDSALQASAIERYLGILQKECQREIHLINDLLDLSRLDSDPSLPILSSLDLQTWLPRITEPFQDRVTKQQQTLALQIPLQMPLLVTAPTDLERILTELLNNACKYTPAQETITILVNVTAEAFAIQVCNTGIDLPSHELLRIFDKFYRIPNNDPWKHGGTGLGLALVKKLVERIGGSITVENQANQLSFTLQLPRQRSVLREQPTS